MFFQHRARKERKWVTMALGLKNRLQEHICRNWTRNQKYNETDSMKDDVEIKALQAHASCPANAFTSSKCHNCQF